MNRAGKIAILAAAALAALALAAPAANAAFGLNNFKVSFEEEGGSAATQAGSHPYAMTTSFGVNLTGEGPEAFTDGRVRNAFLTQIAGIAGDTTVYRRCSTAEFLDYHEGANNQCPNETAVGIVGSNAIEPRNWLSSPIFNLNPPPGVLVRLGFRVVLQNIIVNVGVKPDYPYNPTARVKNISELEYVYGNKFQLWGNPSAAGHDHYRGRCGYGPPTVLEPGEEFEFTASGADCAVSRTTPFLTLPTRCAEPNLTTYAGDSYENPGRFLPDGEPDLSDPAWVTGGFETPTFSGCNRLNFKPSISAQPTSRSAQSPTGLDFSLDVKDEGLKNPEPGATAQSDIRKLVLTLPEGMSANPSLADGLGSCTEADLERETLASAPGEGCPQSSKIGTIEARSPIVSEAIGGSIYLAKPYENLAGDSLIGLYLVFKNPELGVIVKQPTKVTPDPVTGQLVATTEEIPQFPLSRVAVHFREGGRSPLISPPHCGTYEAKAELYPWSGGNPVTSTSSFEIVSGPGGGSCPGAAAPFDPGFEAGTENNAAGRYSPFSMRLTRNDGEQDMTRFSATLPPGVVARLAGTAQCSEAEIAAARAKSGLQERANPSCPAASQIGSVSGGAGVGSELTYVPGKLYLAGPTNGAPLSVVAIVPAVAGPFDVGNVVVRQALRINPRTAKVTADGASSDPLPHILAGIPLNVRDIRVNVDKPSFTLNPTSCAESQTAATIWGGGRTSSAPSTTTPSTPRTASRPPPAPRLPSSRALACA